MYNFILGGLSIKFDEPPVFFKDYYIFAAL